MEDKGANDRSNKNSSEKSPEKNDASEKPDMMTLNNGENKKYKIEKGEINGVLKPMSKIDDTDEKNEKKELFNLISKNFITVAISIVILVSLLLLFSIIVEIWIKTPEIDDNKTLTQYREETAKSWEIYVRWTHEFHQSTYRWQALSTKIIFWISILVPISGIVFSFWQFVEATKEVRHFREIGNKKDRTKASNAQRDDKNGGQFDYFSFQNQIMSIAFKTRSVASLIMFISVAYLIIYGTLIYPINEKSISKLYTFNYQEVAPDTPDESIPVYSIENIIETGKAKEQTVNDMLNK